jgi:hypothetical protein
MDFASSDVLLNARRQRSVPSPRNRRRRTGRRSYLGKPLDYWTGQAAARRNRGSGYHPRCLVPSLPIGRFEHDGGGGGRHAGAGTAGQERAKCWPTILDHIQPWVRPPRWTPWRRWAARPYRRWSRHSRPVPPGTRVRRRWSWARSVPTRGRPCRHSKPRRTETEAMRLRLEGDHRRDPRRGTAPRTVRASRLVPRRRTKQRSSPSLPRRTIGPSSAGRARRDL